MSTHKIRVLVAAVVLAIAPAVHAQTEPVDPNSGQTLVATKIARNFTTLAGGEENALALVRSLRTGTDVSLVTTVPPPAGSPPGTQPTTTTTTFTPPTKPMGWGNVKHALALAQDQLARAGITNPTPAQLQTALMGGDLVVANADGTTTTTAVKGVLTMRADGMGWGNIAKEGGTKLGPVTSKVDMSAKGVKTDTSTTTTTTTTAAGTSTSKGVTTAAGGAATPTPKSKGITTAAGGSAVTATDGKTPKGITTATGATSTHGSRGLVTASGASANANPQGNAYGRGIVTASGGGSTNVAATGAGKGHGGGAGLVTGGGNSAGPVTSGGNNAGGNGKGQGGGNGKGKGG